MILVLVYHTEAELVFIVGNIFPNPDEKYHVFDGSLSFIFDIRCPRRLNASIITTLHLFFSSKTFKTQNIL
jgi:hypothetical protein